MTEMMAEEIQLLNKINERLTQAGLRSKLVYLYVSGLREGIATEWGFEEQIREEAVAANIIVSEEIEKSQ